METIFNTPILWSSVTSKSLASSSTSDMVDLSKADGFSVYAKWTGSPVGSFSLEVSLDGINFVTLPDSATPANGAGDALWEVSTAFYDQVRLVYTASSGSGTVTAQIGAKGDFR